MSITDAPLCLCNATTAFPITSTSNRLIYEGQDLKCFAYSCKEIPVMCYFLPTRLYSMV